MPSYQEVLQSLYPETAVGGYSRNDTTVEFYGRVQALLEPGMTVLDLGAGRGRLMYNSSRWRRTLADLGGDGRTVIAADPDPAVLENQSADERVVMPDPRTIPLPSGSVDCIVANWVLEHVEDPAAMAREIDRVLAPGGWLCAQTPNRHGYIALGARAVPNALHVRVLTRLQPEREARDVFATYYRMNTPATLRRLFPDYFHAIYGAQGPPIYLGSATATYRIARVVLEALPSSLAGVLLVFLRKPEGTGPEADTTPEEAAGTR